MSYKYEQLSTQESQPLTSDDEASKAPKTETWKQIKECGMAVLCLYDFISDIFAAQANAHSEHEELHLLGYFGAGLLLASGVANTVMVTVIRQFHLEAFQELSKRMPFQWHFFRLLSSTSPEILNSFFAIAKASSSIPLSTSMELEVAAGTVKRFGLVAQLLEDIPQFTVQAMSVYLCLQHGWALSAGVLASLGGTLAMVLFKTITNFLALALKCQVSQVVLAEAAEEENRQVKLFPDWTRACQVSVQALMAIFNLLFLLNSGPISFHHSKYFGHLDGRTIGYLSLFISYALAIALSLLLVLQCRDRLWHMLRDLNRSAALLALSSLHPCTLLLADPCVPKVAPCLWNLLFFPPLLRNITVGCLSLWGIWKDPFPVPENYCISLTVLNFLAIFQLIAFIEDAEVEEVAEVSSITSLEHREIETRKLDELFGNLKKSKLADWPRLLEHCPPSFEKHKGISMAMELWKAVDQRKSEAAAEAAKRILASGHNFETLVIQELELMESMGWTRAPEMSSRRNDCAAAVCGEKIYVMSGRDGSGNGPLNSVECFDPKTQKWTAAPEMSSKRYGCSAAVCGDKIYVIGGRDGSGNCLKSMECFDPKTQKWTRAPEMSSERWACSAAVCGEKIYVIGGSDGSLGDENPQEQEVECFNPKTQKWTRAPEMSLKRHGCAAAVCGDKIYVMGGQVEDEHDRFLEEMGGPPVDSKTQKVECFDPKTEKWTRAPEMSSKRYGCAAAVFGEKIYVMGGFGSDYLKSMECFDPKTQKWTRGAKMSSKREGCAAAVCGDKIYVIGGYDGSGNRLNSMEWLLPFDAVLKMWGLS